MEERHTASAYWALRVALGVVPIVAGLDKFTNLLTDWAQYLSPLAQRLLPISPGAFMRAAGVVEIVVGAAILAGKARYFGFVAAAWLAAITIDLLTTGHFLDIAARDAVLAVAAFALGRLAQVHERAHAAAPLSAHRPATVP
ncbi:DoxX family membrane protein [Anaeromyxobacter diazotrophicus]|nr:DoxX family membrane protein [Anaeromyxobacter diazotrophicus]